MSMKSQLSRRLDKEAVKRAKNKSGTPEFIRLRVEHVKANARHQSARPQRAAGLEDFEE